MLTDLSDAQLARHIADGSSDAETELCRRMWPRIRLYGMKHLRSADAAEDLAQHVLVLALEALRAGKLQDPEKLAAFVLGISRMTMTDQRRRADRRDELLSRFWQEWQPVVVEPTVEIDGDRLARCVGALKERERSVVMLTFYDEASGIEAAASLGISEANVRVIRHRALHSLRACMGVAAES